LKCGYGEEWKRSAGLIKLLMWKLSGQRGMETPRKDVKNLLYSRRLLMIILSRQYLTFALYYLPSKFLPYIGLSQLPYLQP